MLCETNNIMWNILYIYIDYVNIPHNIVSPTKHYYGYE